jgi:acetyltransferase-like isoleucine patch superfamily enzyme
MREICWLIWRVWQKLTLRPALYWRRLALYARGVRYGRGLLVERGVTLDNLGELDIGDNVWLGQNVYAHVWPGAKLVIEHDTYIGRGSIILAHQSVRIGHHGMVAPYCYITDVNHGHQPGRLMREQPLESKPIDIGPDVWFGAGCSVLPGVRIGQGCVVGARGVVAKDLPDYAIAVGAPAKPIKFRAPTVVQPQEPAGRG